MSAWDSTFLLSTLARCVMRVQPIPFLPRVDKLVVCNPRKNALLKDGNKSDRIDAHKLAELLRGNQLKPVNWDIVFGITLIILILEGMRRASGWVMPAVVIAFILYAFYGEYLPGSSSTPSCSGLRLC